MVALNARCSFGFQGHVTYGITNPLKHSTFFTKYVLTLALAPTDLNEDPPFLFRLRICHCSISDIMSTRCAQLLWLMSLSRSLGAHSKYSYYTNDVLDQAQGMPVSLGQSVLDETKSDWWIYMCIFLWYYLSLMTLVLCRPSLKALGWAKPSWLRLSQAKPVIAAQRACSSGLPFDRLWAPYPSSITYLTPHLPYPDTTTTTTTMMQQLWVCIGWGPG